MKGQMFSSDFILSIVLFTATLLLLLPLWNDVNLQIADAEAKKDLQIAATSISSLLVKTPGSPWNWTPDTVGSIGFSNARQVMNLTKFEYLREINYTRAKELLGINQYNFSINITDEYGLLATSGVARSPVAYFSAQKEELKAVIAYSGLTWDFYWGHDLPASTPASADARFFYDGLKLDMMNAMLFNASVRHAYRTIIIEQPNIDLSDINETALRNFLLGGGRLIIEGTGYGGELRDTFGANSSPGANTDGLVVKPDWFVRAQNGSTIDFQNSEWAVISGSSPVTVEVADPLNGSRGLVAQWDYGTGRIYYITDINATIAGAPLSTVLNIAGERLEYGSYPVNGTDIADIAVSSRLVVLEGDEADGRRLATMQLLVWK
ncbi:MAG: hypothetical protein Q7T16_01020 [Candidatus Burarchaeum sp.]|nr:hypothetical protein [Candidatus Burarchaeum sp.]MDO8339217.1 hypothetical protein [Candidatus Burarchaeum sp.]